MLQQTVQDPGPDSGDSAPDAEDEGLILAEYESDEESAPKSR